MYRLPPGQLRSRSRPHIARRPFSFACVGSLRASHFLRFSLPRLVFKSDAPTTSGQKGGVRIRIQTHLRVWFPDLFGLVLTPVGRTPTDAHSAFSLRISEPEAGRF